MPTTETKEALHTSKYVISCSSSTSDETGCGMSIPDGTLTVRVATEHRSKYTYVPMSPVMYHYESTVTVDDLLKTKNHMAVAKEWGKNTKPSWCTTFGGVDCSHGSYAVCSVGPLESSSKWVDATPEDPEKNGGVFALVKVFANFVLLFTGDNSPLSFATDKSSSADASSTMLTEVTLPPHNS